MCTYICIYWNHCPALVCGGERLNFGHLKVSFSILQDDGNGGSEHRDGERAMEGEREGEERDG